MAKFHPIYPSNYFLKWGAVWICVEKDVQANEKSLAYIAFPDGTEYTDFQQKLKKVYPWLQCMTRSASDRIRQAINSMAVRHLPKHWDRQNESEGELPQGIVQDSI